MSETEIDKKKIESLLPHREPMLLIDKLTKIVPLKSATAIMYVKKDGFYVQGHFPGQPVMPGVLIVEAFGQAAAALTEAKGEAEKNERRNGARQTAERDAREKFGTERTIGSNAAEYAKRSAIESISSTCSERPRGHRGKRKRAYERGASSVAYRNGQTGETSQVVTACTNARSATRREVESGKGQGEKTPGDIKFKHYVVAPTTAAISTTHRYVGANEYDHGEHNFKHFKSGV